MKVIKRNNDIVEFDKEKIEKAILDCIEETNEDITEDDREIARRISYDIKKSYEAQEHNDNLYIDIEDIQDSVEDELMNYGATDIAKAYILYRERRKEIREKQARLYQDSQNKIKEILSLNNIENSNANVDEYSSSGQNKRISDFINKDYALNNVVKEHIANLHKEGKLYIHDLDNYNIGVHNCLLIDFTDLFENNKGFTTRNTDVRKPNSIMTFFQLVAVVFQLQSLEQFGGIGSGKIDFEAAPYVAITFKKAFKNALQDINDLSKKEAEDFVNDIINNHGDIIKLENSELKALYPNLYKIAERHTIEQTKQATESLYHNLGTLQSRSGAQLPFTSINFGMDTSPEGRLVTKCLLESSIEGIGRYHRTPIFPISIFSHKKGINADPGDPNYDLKLLAIESLSKRIYPNFANCDAPHLTNDYNNTEEIFATMGCRTMLGFDVNGLGNTQSGRGNICPTTINLCDLGIKYGICLGERKEADLDGFWKELDELLKVAEESLLDRFEWIANKKARCNPFLYENGLMKNTIGRKLRPDEEVRECVKHGSLAIGYHALADCCIALFGKHHGEDEDVYKFAYSVVEHIYNYAKEATERNHLNFSCYATPAENLCSTLRDKMYEKYGLIPKITDKEYLTNSHHIPVDYNISIQRKIDLEAPFAKLATGGNITYVELDSNAVKNKKAIEKIINYAMKSGISYFALNFPISHCNNCHYDGDMNDVCPECGSDNIEILGRVTGYLTSDYRNFNKGKQAEFKNRVKHNSSNFRKN